MNHLAADTRNPESGRRSQFEHDSSVVQVFADMNTSLEQHACLPILKFIQKRARPSQHMGIDSAMVWTEGKYSHDSHQLFGPSISPVLSEQLMNPIQLSSPITAMFS